MNAPIRFQWMGDAMVPPPGRFAAECDRIFVIGEHYLLVEHEDRSPASHKHYFAAVKEAWANLPEADALRYPTPEHLRKWALIAAGYHQREEFVASSQPEALRIASFMRVPDAYAVLTVKRNVVVRYTARSQSLKAMGREEFQRSKDAVLAVLAERIGVRPDELSNARAA